MDASSLKTFVDVRIKETRNAQSAPPGANPVSVGLDYGVSVGAGQARQGWRFFQPPYKELPGVISKWALEQHLNLYAGYLSRSKSNEPMQAAERLRVGDGCDVSSAILHELYFSGLSLLSPSPSLAVQSAFLDRWGALESWWAEVIDAGIAAKGWVVTATRINDPADLQVFAMDAHDAGFPPGYAPICVVDVNEHAYWMDHGTNKAKYLEMLYKYICWEALDERYTATTR
jgi:superoxide dismutase, Fe-Mn family